MDAVISQNAPLSAVERGLAAGALVLGSAAAAVVWYFNPTTSGFFPVCPMYRLTGFACPGCGLTRGFHALFHGDVSTALGYNALIPFYLLMFGFAALSLASIVVRGRGFMRLSDSPKILFAVLALLLTFGVLRNLPFYPFTLLYP